MCYMKTVTHREMRNSSGEILRMVAAGETVLVTNNGRVAATISPPGRAPVAQLAADGQARLPRQPAAALKSISRRKSTRTTAEIIGDSRGRW